MPQAAVCILVGGRPSYVRVARQAVLSVLDHTDFDAYVGHSIDLGGRIPHADRVTLLPLEPPVSKHRSYRFLQKFDLLHEVLGHSDSELVMMLDADAVLARAVDDTDLRSALDGRGLAMAEQTGIVRSTTSRPDFLQHYTRYSLAFIEPAALTPSLDDFRFFNSGVVVAERTEMSELVAWARDHIATSERDHQVGEHMIADQDYFQVWANSLHRDSCSELPWQWNHCELWDDGFPRDGLRIAHFSNFCQGPADDTAERMKEVRLGGRRRSRVPRLRRLLGHRA